MKFGGHDERDGRFGDIFSVRLIQALWCGRCGEIAYSWGLPVRQREIYRVEHLTIE